MDITKTNIACKYEELKHNTKFCFVGAFKKTPCDNDMVLLCLIMQTYKKKRSRRWMFKKNSNSALSLKPINESANAKHHKCIGSIFGFGSCKDMNVTEELDHLSRNMLSMMGTEEWRWIFWKKRMAETRMCVKDFV